MAGELGVVVVALSQLNDAGQLRESRAIGQDTDIVLVIEDPKSDNLLERTIFIEKNRNGPRGAKVTVHFHGDCVKFADVTHQTASRNGTYRWEDHGRKKVHPNGSNGDDE